MKAVRLFISVLVPLVIGGVAGLFTANAIPLWYEQLIQPSFNPPNQVFGPVWTTLYILMGVSCYRIWIQPAGEEKRRALLVYALQLFLNFCWSFIFFYFQLIGWALVEIILLWISILLMIRLFYRIDKVSAWLNIPYLLWVSFATILNAAYFYLNG
jgi:benzodiazapine receptor